MKIKVIFQKNPIKYSKKTTKKIIITPKLALIVTSKSLKGKYIWIQTKQSSVNQTIVIQPNLLFQKINFRAHYNILKNKKNCKLIDF